MPANPARRPGRPPRSGSLQRAERERLRSTAARRRRQEAGPELPPPGLHFRGGHGAAPGLNRRSGRQIPLVPVLFLARLVSIVRAMVPMPRAFRLAAAIALAAPLAAAAAPRA